MITVHAFSVIEVCTHTSAYNFVGALSYACRSWPAVAVYEKVSMEGVGMHSKTMTSTDSNTATQTDKRSNPEPITSNTTP